MALNVAFKFPFLGQAKTRLNIVKKTDIIENMFFDHNRAKLYTYNRNKSGKPSNIRK